MADRDDGKPGLAQMAMDAVTSGRVKVTPERYATSYLDWLGEKDKGARLEAATAAVIKAGQVRTYDMGGSSTTLEMGRAIAAAARK